MTEGPVPNMAVVQANDGFDVVRKVLIEKDLYLPGHAPARSPWPTCCAQRVKRVANCATNNVPMTSSSIPTSVKLGTASTLN